MRKILIGGLTGAAALAMGASAAYADGDVTVDDKGTDQGEMEVSVTFAF